MTSRIASNTTPPTWNMKPTQLNRTSPALASATPTAMPTTFTTFSEEGRVTPQRYETTRTATGPPALSIWMKATLRYRYTRLLQTSEAE